MIKNKLFSLKILKLIGSVDYLFLINSQKTCYFPVFLYGGILEVGSRGLSRLESEIQGIFSSCAHVSDLRHPEVHKMDKSEA